MNDDATNTIPPFQALESNLSWIEPDYILLYKFSSIGDLVGFFLNIILALTFGLSIVGIAYSFVMLILSRGDIDPKKGERAKVVTAQRALTWSVIVFILTFFIISLQKNFFSMLGINLPDADL